MLTIISPAKNMRTDRSGTKPLSLPVFLENAQAIHGVLAQYAPWDLQGLMGLNPTLAEDCFDRNLHMRFDLSGTSAVEAYDGIQYKYMNPFTFSARAKSFAQGHLRILSGMYGVLRPYDSICEYRLEMQTKLSVGGSRNLYDFWGSLLAQELLREDHTILNLASNEYAKCIRPYLGPQDRFITCTFQVFHKGRYKVQATAAKMARGMMARYLMTRGIDDPLEARGFCEGGYAFAPEASSSKEFVFRRNGA